MTSIRPGPVAPRSSSCAKTRRGNRIDGERVGGGIGRSVESVGQRQGLPGCSVRSGFSTAGIAAPSASRSPGRWRCCSRDRIPPGPAWMSRRTGATRCPRAVATHVYRAEPANWIPLPRQRTSGVAAHDRRFRANPGVTSRFTSRPYFSTMGVLYSQRAPALMVSPGPTRQSSVKYAS